MSKSIRYFLGTIVTSATLFDILTINPLQHYTEDNKLIKKHILTITKLPYIEPNQGDLVLTLQNKKYIFKIVQTKPGKYSDVNRYGMMNYVPPGFFILRNIQNGEKSLQCCGSIIGQQNYDISWIWDRFNL